MHQVALVGGFNTRAFKGHLTAAGLSICAEIPTLPVRVPQRATALVVLRTHCSHKLYDTCQQISNRRNIPMVTVDQSWAKARDLLIQTKLLSEPKPEPEPKPQQRTIYDFQAEIVEVQEVLTLFEEWLLEQGWFDHLADSLEGLETVLDCLSEALEELARNARFLPKTQKTEVLADLEQLFNIATEDLEQIFNTTDPE